jgi:hypothetical protein
MYQFGHFCVILHSILRWGVLIMALVVLGQSLQGMSSKKLFKSPNKRSALLLLICCDLQLVLGLLLFYLNGWADRLKDVDVMTDKYKRFFIVEHSVGMLVAIILVHIGYSATKSNLDDRIKFKRLFWCVLAALVIVIMMIPWPFRPIVGAGRPWLRLS